MFSIFAKKGTNDFFQIRFNAASGSGRANFDLNNGTTGGVSGVTATITDVGNGWYRCTAMEATNATTSGAIQISLIGALTDGSIPTNTLSTTVYFWGAQLEQRSAPTAYTPTTTALVVKYQPALQTEALGAARFDHSPTTGESKGLLIEEARTNIAYPSNQQSGTQLARVTQNTTGAIAPDGTQTASIVRETTETGAHHIHDSIVGETANTVYTVSIYLKNYGVSDVSLKMRLSDSGDVYKQVFLDLDNIVVSSSPDTGYTGTITDVGNGWRRCTITGDVGDGTNDLRVHVFACQGTGTTTSYAGNGWDGFGYWGLQVEAGTFPTSYIPTTGSAVTRAVDAAEITGSNLTYAISQTSGTLYGSGIANETATGGSKPRLAVLYLASDTGINKNSISLQRNNAALEGGIYYDGVLQSYFFGDSGQLANYATGKLALGYELNSANLGSNGTIETTDTAVNAPYVNVLRIGSSGYGQSWNGTIDKIAFYPKRLSNATLQAMTTE